MNKILFSPIGDTDPVRGGFDGAMLHIVRHFKPDIIYLYFTKKMSEIDYSTNVYQRFIHKINSDCRVIKKHTDIEDASNFEYFVHDFEEIINEIVNDYPDCELLINASSGTPQMKINLCLLAVTSSITPTLIQVQSPNKGSNRDVSHENDYSDSAFENNFDNLPNSENRCVINPNILGFRKAKIKSQVKALIENYDYRAASNILKPEKELFTKEIFLLLEHARLRIHDNYHSAIKLINKNSYFEFLKNKVSSELCDLIEYLSIMGIKQRQGELTDFILRINPFITKLSQIYINKSKILKLENITDRRMRLKRELIEKSSPDLMSFLDYEFSIKNSIEEGSFRDNSEIGATNLIILLKYVVKNSSFNKDAKESLLIILDFFKTVLRTRNELAHNILITTEEELKNDLGKDSKSIFNDIFKLVKFLFSKELSSVNFEIYNTINKRVIKKMDNSIV
ncbi:UNVERIFIED_CONTAM: CRISPR type III-A/MTUBE-associated protein Csm6 [Acetivibrio alkalicellulosi]